MTNVLLQRLADLLADISERCTALGGTATPRQLSRWAGENDFSRDLREAASLCEQIELTNASKQLLEYSGQINFLLAMFPPTSTDANKLIYSIKELDTWTRTLLESTERQLKAYGKQSLSNLDDEKTKSFAVWLGNDRVQVGGDVISLEPQFAEVLEALVELQAATKPKLQERSGRDDPDKLLKKLVTRFPQLGPYIIFPGKRGKGGYRTSIVTRKNLPLSTPLSTS